MDDGIIVDRWGEVIGDFPPLCEVVPFSDGEYGFAFAYGNGQFRQAHRRHVPVMSGPSLDVVLHEVAAAELQWIGDFLAMSNSIDPDRPKKLALLKADLDARY